MSHLLCKKRSQILVSYCVQCREGIGVDSSLLGWGIEGRVKLGLQLGYMAQKLCTGHVLGKDAT